MKINTSVHRALRLAGQAQNVQFSASINATTGSALYKRIEMYLMKGVLTSGNGYALVHELYGDAELSRIEIYSRLCLFPFGATKRKVCPFLMTAYQTPAALKLWAEQHNENERARWTLMGGTKANLPYSVTKGPKKEYGSEDFRMYLTGLVSKAQIVKEVVPIIMTPARLAKGQALFEKFKRNPVIEIHGSY